MAQKASTDQNNAQCSRCGKPLGTNSCPICSGKGYIREFLLLKNTCNFCNGSGNYFGCPDENKHRIEDFMNSLNRRNTLRYPSRIPIMRVNTGTSNICPFCQGRGSTIQRTTTHIREPDRTVTEYVPVYEPGSHGGSGGFVTRPRTTTIPGRVTSKIDPNYVTCPYCGGSGKKK
jgi:hypothetical protein